MSAEPRAYVVTAAAGGIGGALVERLLAAGHGVYAVDISSRRLAALAERAGAHAGRLQTRKADVADETGVAALAGEAVARFGRVHGLANVAGGIAGIGEDLIDRPLERIGIDELRGGAGKESSLGL